MLFLFSDTVLMTKSLRGGEELQFVVMFNLFGASLQGRNTSSDAIAKQTVNRSSYGKHSCFPYRTLTAYRARPFSCRWQWVVDTFLCKSMFLVALHR